MRQSRPSNRSGAGRNLRSDLKRRRRQASPMQAYDDLPQPLRQWLAQACLPWSANSVLKIWNRIGGAKDPVAAIGRLNAVEQAMLQKDSKVWAKSD